MTDPKAFLLTLNKSLSTLREREAKYGGNAPLELLNQIDDHEKAKALTQQRINNQISETEWREALKPLLVSIEAATSVSQLETYIDRMSGLLLKENLRESKSGDLVRNIARTRTLEVLRRLDGEEKGTLLRFLYEAGLINKDKRVIDLRDANFSEVNLGGVVLLSGISLERVSLKEANLERAILEGADLSMAKLSGANLSGAILMRAILIGANLSTANLQKAVLIEADLMASNLEGANLEGAILIKANLNPANLRQTRLRGADLNGANLSFVNMEGAEVTDKQLSVVASLKEATLPNGTKHD